MILICSFRQISHHRNDFALQRSGYETRSPLLRVDKELEELLLSSPAPSDDDILESDDSQLSDVSELLMERSERWNKSPNVRNMKYILLCILYVL